MKQKARFAVLAGALALAAAHAGAVTLTFEDLPEGTVLSNQYAGVTFSANAFRGAGGPTGDWGTNTDMTITATDIGALGSPAMVSGNVLHAFGNTYAGWLTEDGDPSMLVSFSSAVSSFSADFAGIFTATDVTLTVYNGAAVIGTVVAAACAATCQQTLSFAAASITAVAMTPGSFDDGFAADNITFTAAVPEVSTYAMMGLGLALLAFKRPKQA
jgi:hypothetical protein